jgi:hypothetical protein
MIEIMRAGSLEMLDHAGDGLLGRDGDNEMNMIVPAVDGIYKTFQFGCLVHQVGIEPLFDLGLDQRFTVLGRPYQMIIQPPKGHGVPLEAS